MAALRLDPSIPLMTPKGKGRAIIWESSGEDQDDLWRVVLDNGQIWTFRNREVRVRDNYTMGTTCEWTEAAFP